MENRIPNLIVKIIQESKKDPDQIKSGLDNAFDFMKGLDEATDELKKGHKIYIEHYSGAKKRGVQLAIDIYNADQDQLTSLKEQYKGKGLENYFTKEDLENYKK